MRRIARRLLKIAAVLFALAALAAVMVVITLRSPWFHEKARQRIVSELERVTGGEAALGDWVFNWELFTVGFTELTLRGTEPADSPPLLHSKSVHVGLKLISLWKRDVDIEALIVDEPRVHIIVNADRSTNIPRPKVSRPGGKARLEPLIDWKIGRIALRGGSLVFAERRWNINLRGENLHAQLAYDVTRPRYEGAVSVQPLRMDAPWMNQAEIGVDMAVALEKNRIEIARARLDLRRSRIEAWGTIDDLVSPKLDFNYKGRIALYQAGQMFRIRAVRQGTADVEGTFRYASAGDYELTSAVRARNVDVAQDGLRVSGAHVRTNVRLGPGGMEWTAINADVLGGRFTGRASFPAFRRFIVEGAADAIPIQQAIGAFGAQAPEAVRTIWSGAATGPVRAEGPLGRGSAIVASANVTIAPQPGAIPVEGAADIRYDGRNRTLSLGRSRFATPGARLDVAGVLGEQLAVQASSTNLEELLPVINAFAKSPIHSLPVRLKNGKASFDGQVSGKIASPRIEGAVAVSRFAYSGIDFDAFSGQIHIDESSLILRNGAVARHGAKARISVEAALTAWRLQPSNRISATAALTGAQISELLEIAGRKDIPVGGALALTADVSGSVDDPHAAARITVTKGVAYDEPFDRLQASVNYTPQSVTIRDVRLTMGAAQITAGGAFEPSRPFGEGPLPRSGRVRFEVSTNEMQAQRFEAIKRLRRDLSGTVRASVQGAAELRDRGPDRLPDVRLTALDGDVTGQGLRAEGRPLGSLRATAATRDDLLRIQFNSDFLDSNIVSTSQWKLVPGYPGEGALRFSKISLGAIRDWLNEPESGGSLNFEGSATGSIAISGPALEPRTWRAIIELRDFEAHPLERAAKGTRFSLRNDGPVIATMEGSALKIASARFTGNSTDVQLSGGAALDPRPSLDLRVNGNVNLGIVRNFTEDLETDGGLIVNASIRGPISQPLINGRMELRRASASLADIPTGITAANGVIIFSGNQATIQELSGFVGGGRVDVSGSVGYAGGELSYRVNATAKDVRVRYPEGASTSANAELSLRGASRRSTLSGNISVLRTGFNPRTDFYAILGKASEPVRTPAAARTGPLSGMHFDIRIETAPDISFESSLAQDIQVEGNLRLQGTLYNPVLLGRLNITQGEINFLGTRYTINNGSITFANPVKMEPVINVDLETRVQGIDIILTVSGPINKLNLSPRSDPPLEFAQVLALLATGSTPTTDPALARQTQSNQTFTQLGASALIGQVVANPVSSRLQRFFGVSRLKIDPQLTGVENNPQARITLEQQVARNLTFTYITNVASSNQQIVRVEWSLNRTWSLIAVRDENGLFGMDFRYKKSFK